MPDPTRRRLLKSTAVGVTLGAAGCMEQVSDLAGTDSSDEAEGNGTEPTSDSDTGADYAAWLPSPEAYDSNHYVFDLRRPSAILDNESHLEENASMLQDVSDFKDPFSPTEMDLLLSAGTLDTFEITVIVGGYDTGEVETAAKNGSLGFELSAAGDLHGFTIYEADGGGDALAVSEDAVVTSERRQMLEPAIEAWAGERERYVDTSDHLRTVIDTLGDGTSLKAQTYEPDQHQRDDYVPGAVASGSVLQVNGSTTAYTGTLVFEDGKAAGAEVQTDFSGREYFESLREIDVTTDGRVAVVTGTADTASLGRTYPYFGGLLVESRVTESSPENTPSPVEIVQTAGHVTDTDRIGWVEMTVRLRSDTETVDFSEVTVDWDGPSGEYRLAYDSKQGADGRFGLSPIKDENGSFPVLSGLSDRFLLACDLGEPDELDTAFGERLAAGETATVRITPPSGDETTAELQVPESLASKRIVPL